MSDYRQREIEAARLAMKDHACRLGLEAQHACDTALWHLLLSLMEWCDESGISFDATLSEVRAHFAAEREEA